MTDARFTKLLDRAAAAGRKHGQLLEKAEAEYERRYGKNPSDADDDQWIDAMTLAGGQPVGLTAAEVERHAISYAGLKRIAK